MSDLTATNCGCGCDNNGTSCNSLIWILLLLSCCGNGTNLLGNNGCGNGCGNDCSCLILLLILFCGLGNGNSCF